MEYKRCKDCLYFSNLFYNNKDYGKCCKLEISVYIKAIECSFFKNKEIKRGY